MSKYNKYLLINNKYKLLIKKIFNDSKISVLVKDLKKNKESELLSVYESYSLFFSVENAEQKPNQNKSRFFRDYNLEP